MGGATSLISAHVPAKRRELCVPGISLHFDDMNDKLRMMLDSKLTTEVDAVAAGVGFDDDVIIGQSKTDPKVLAGINAYFNKLVRNKHLLAPNYQFVGNGNHAENLKHFCTTNAFFTPAIGLGHDAAGNRVFTVNSLALENTPATLFTRAIAMYDPSYPRVNATFDYATFSLVSFRVYNAHGEDKTADYPTTTEDPHQPLAYLCTLLLYFAQVVHATIHIFDLTMATGILDATEHDAFLLKFVQPYTANLYVKYVEVETLLIAKESSLTTKAFRSDYDALVVFCKELLVLWFHQPSAEALLRQFFFSGITATATGTPEERSAILDELLSSNLLLAEWRKHLAHAKPFAEDLIRVFTRRKPGVIEKTDGLIHDYFKKIGNDVATVASFQTWMELMVGMNLLHGNTLSMTRLQLHPSILATLTPEEATFTARDNALATLLLATISGIEPHRRVFGSDVLGQASEYPLLRAVMIKYDTLMTNAQAAYYDQLAQQPELFAQYGWILSDYCLEGIDRKQMTLTTYI
jgi:hypothetical protein